MYSVKDTALESNPYLKINFDGGDLSSDSGLLLIKDSPQKDIEENGFVSVPKVN